MIGFKVVNIDNSNAVNRWGDDCELAITQSGRILSHVYGEGYCKHGEENHKAVPSIIIDGFEWYHGIVGYDESGNKYIFMIGEYIDITGTKCYGAHVFLYYDPCDADGQMPAYSETFDFNDCNWFIRDGDVWQPEYRHLLPLLEVSE